MGTLRLVKEHNMTTSRKNNFSTAIILIVIISAGVFYWNNMYREGTKKMVSDDSMVQMTTKLADQEFVTVGNFRIRAEMNPSTPEIGDNTLSIWVRDQNDQVVESVQARAVVQFEQDSNDSAINIPIELQSIQPGHLQGSVTLEKEGEWALAIDVEAASLGHGSYPWV